MLVRHASAAALLAAALLHAPPAPAQQGGAMPGYSPAAAERQRAAEAEAIRSPSPERAREHARALSAEPHVAGTEGQARTRDYVIQQMRAMGLDTDVRAYSVYLPHATSVRVWRVAPDLRELDLAEPPIPGDPATALPQYPAANGYSAAGDTTAEVVYVGYGLVEDYARLDSLGVSVKGRIAIARYGRSFRGIKAREAEKHGAVALLLYSDPEEDGPRDSLAAYPAGPMRPPHAIQRGSVFNGAGDPSTPRGSSHKARRVPVARMAIPRIPVVAISAANAAELLRGLAGTEAPEGWQGGLPFRYHLGAGPVRARVVVETDEARAAYKQIWNTFGTIRGSEYPDEVIVVGAHRDAWGPGAADDVSGTVSVLEMARAVSEQVRAGNRPKRTLVFATWDAEEWGLIGSTEYVEEDSARLWRGGVAYLNQDVAATGPNFDAGGSPSLRALLRDVARQVPDPSGRGSVYDAWRARAAVADSLEPPIGDPGGGSDFAGFYNHLGIPHLDWGFGGPYGVYHSQYDTQEWMSRYGDPGYTRHAAAAAVGTALLLRLANADVLPYDYLEFARTMRGYLPRLDSMFLARGWAALDTRVLEGTIARMERSAAALSRARDEALAAGTADRRAVAQANRALLRVERALTRARGLRTRPWYRSLIYASDENNGYADVVFPSVVEAVRAGDRRLAEVELADLAQRFVIATNALIAATTALTGENR